MQAESLVRVACVQMDPRVGEPEANIAESIARIEAAAHNGARLIVLPELCNSGYVFETREEAFELAEEIPGGKACSAWIDAAQRCGCWIAAGIAERADGKLYNASILIGPDGYFGKYRKMHLWAAENLFFEPGDLGFPVFSTPIGRIAMLICYDGWFPEAWRLCALQGADIVCVPTNWVPIPGQAPAQMAMANVLAMAAAHSNSLFVAAADRVGVERGQPFLGRSLIVSCTGWPVAGPASDTEAQTLFADLNLSEARRMRNWNEFNQILRDRRTDAYDRMLGSDAKPGWY
ncbi:MAG TPA: nitrilase family protein [Burkholderiaceae bacterium]|nr:nitrilase family protein [Burkholderiaceae bacterium]